MEYREIKVTAAQSVRFQNGGALDLCRTALKDGSLENEILRVKAPDGRFLGLGTTDMEKQALAVYKLF